MVGGRRRSTEGRGAGGACRATEGRAPEGSRAPKGSRAPEGSRATEVGRAPKGRGLGGASRATKSPKGGVVVVTGLVNPPKLGVSTLATDMQKVGILGSRIPFFYPPILVVEFGS